MNSAKTIASGSGKPKVFHEVAEHDRAEADDRPDREVDAAGDDDEGHRQRDEPDLRHQPALIEQVVDREEAVVERAEADQRDDEDDRQQRLVALEPPRRPAGGGFRDGAHFFHPRAARRWRRRISAMTVARIRPPRKASVQ